MTQLFNKSFLRNTRKSLRNNQTEAEKKLWLHLRNKQMNGLKFRRQFSIGSYILDFYCPEKHIAIELDGSQHAKPDVSKYDIERTEYLKSLGIKVLRFWNNEVIENMEGVLDQINKGVDS
jgi:very-short-patch-repair endonuclease